MEYTLPALRSSVVLVEEYDGERYIARGLRAPTHLRAVKLGRASYPRFRVRRVS